jgi:hypothetical protein
LLTRAPANGSYDVQFKLYDALTGGTQVGATVTNATIAATNGVFTTQRFRRGVFSRRGSLP